MPSETETIEIPPIQLVWSEWHAWEELQADARRRGGIQIPNKTSGVYEARYLDADERLTIGKASDLRMRVRQGMIKGKTKHSAGTRIRRNEDTARVVVRWAVTNRPAATEEQLHRMHAKRFGRLPKYVQHT